MNSNKIIRKHKVFEENGIVESFYFPKYLTLETCNNCNAKCLMCPKSLEIQTRKEIMSDILFDKLLGELADYTDWVEMICLNSDGEPTLDKSLPERIAKLKKIGIKRVNISTNAQALNEELAQKLIDSKLDDLRISIDSIHKDIYEKLRQGLNFEQVMDNIINVIKLRDENNSVMEIRIRMVELPENTAEKTEWLDFWQKKISTKDKVQIMPAHTWSGVVSEEQESNIAFYANIPCSAPFTSCAINYDGLVQLCDSDIKQSQIVGDCNKNSIKDIWQGEKLQYIRKLHLQAQRNELAICRGCDHWSRIFL